MLKNLAADDAMELMISRIVSVSTETVGLMQAAGRVSAEEIRAQLNIPPFDKSPYDGYALRAEDTADASASHPVTLRITEELPAGTAPTVALAPGFAAKILTGAPLPKGANTTVKYEMTTFTDTTVTISEPLKVWSDVVFSGEDVQCGDRLCESGVVLDAAMLAELAGQGMTEVRVYRKPQVTLLTTGSELAAPGTERGPAQIYDTNTPLIGLYLEKLGCAIRSANTVPDDPERIAAILDRGLRETDLVVTTGGASVGDYDWAVRSAEMIGAEILFWKANIKPGGSVLAAMRDGKLILSLSGSPGAAVIAMQRLALPCLKKLCGRKDIRPHYFDAVMKTAFPKKSPKLRLIRGHLELDGGKVFFCAHEGQENGVVHSLSGCSGFAEIPAGSDAVPAGAVVRVFEGVL